MRTALVTPCYLEGDDLTKSNRLERNKRYIAWYKSIQTALGFDDIWLFDNASTFNNCLNVSATIHCDTIDAPSIKPGVNLLRFTEHLPRGPGENEYPYCWRAVWEIKQLIEAGYEKIILIDSDCFITSAKLAQFVRECNSGWITLWCEKYNFPTAEFQIINKDAFPLFLDYTTGHWKFRVGRLMEKDLPYTVNRDFKADRYGDSRIPWDDSMDGYFQAPVDTTLGYRP